MESGHTGHGPKQSSDNPFTRISESSHRRLRFRDNFKLFTLSFSDKMDITPCIPLIEILPTDPTDSTDSTDSTD